MPFKPNSEIPFVFMVQHVKGGYWGFPKGHPIEGDGPRQTAERELLEETGLKVVSYIDTMPIQESYTVYREGVAVCKTVIYFPAWVEGQEFLQAEEIMDGQWLNESQTLERLTFDSLKPQLIQLFQKLFAS